MANHWDKDTAIEIFGEVMGNHFFSKWASAKNPDLGTMRLFYEMGPNYLQKLIDYIHKTTINSISYDTRRTYKNPQSG